MQMQLGSVLTLKGRSWKVVAHRENRGVQYSEYASGDYRIEENCHYLQRSIEEHAVGDIITWDYHYVHLQSLDEPRRSFYIYTRFTITKGDNSNGTERSQASVGQAGTVAA